MKKLSTALVAVFVVACEAPPPPSQPVEAVPTTVKEEPTKSDPACVGPITAGTPTSLTINGVAWELNGSTLKQKAPAKSLKLGVIADIKEASDENKSNVREFAQWFAKEKVDAVVVDGDTGETDEDLVSSLETLAGTKVPVLVIIGNRESKGVYTRALAAVRAKHPNVFDLNQVRRIDTGAADLVSMPGYFNPSYIHPEDGCRYYPADVDAMAALAKTCDSPVVVISHGGPKQDGALGIDRTAEGANVGDPELARVLAEGKIPFGIFANIHEAGGRATDLAGHELREAGKPYDSLYLAPGPADGVRWVMNDGSESIGMAATLTIRDGKASYVAKRIPNPNARVERKAIGKK